MKITDYLLGLRISGLMQLQGSGKPGGMGNVTIFRKYNLSQLINEKIHNWSLSEDEWIKGEKALILPCL